MCSLLLDMHNHTAPAAALAPIATTELSRRDVRAIIFHLLYAADAYDYHESSISIIENINHGFGLSIEFDGEISATLNAILAQRNTLDQLYQPLLANWRLDRISVSTKLILRYAAWELTHTVTDRRIIINEAVELAKCFAEIDAYRFINGILDKIVQEIPSSHEHFDSALE